MTIRPLFTLDTIGKQFIIPSVCFIVLLFATLTAINVTINNSSIRAQMDKRGNAMADYMAKTSVFYYVNYDLGALDGFVQEVIKDPDVAYAVFSDEQKRPLTITSRKPADTASLMNYGREIKDDTGKTIGQLSLGYSPSAVSAVVRRGIWIMLVTMAAALIVLVAGITLFVRSVVSKPLEGITSAMKRFGDDLTVRIPVTTRNEIGELARGFNGLADNLYSIIKEVSETTSEIDRLVKEIASAIGEEATVAAQQSAAVAEITSTMEELSASSNQIAEHSNAVVGIATRTWNNTKTGAGAVETVMAKMSEISVDSQKSVAEIVDLGRRSKEISKVMEIINAIADQTKLIAFNAAIEAASAGESGRRFGVVAGEIRRLADSVMESTGEISGKIGEIQQAINRLVVASEKSAKNIQEGTEFSSQTAATLSSIVEDAHETTNAAKQISLSTQQQKTASDQVVIALREIVAGAEHTSRAMERVSSVSKKVTEVTTSQRALVEQFKVANAQ